MSNDIEAYMSMKDELIRKYHGQVAVFYKGKLVCVDRDVRKAIEKAVKKTGANDFFIKELFRPEEQASTIL